MLIRTALYSFRESVSSVKTHRDVCVAGALCSLSAAAAFAGPPPLGCGEYLLLSHYESLADSGQVVLELDGDPYPELVPTTVTNGVFRIVQTNEHGELRSGPRINYPTGNSAFFELAFDLEGDGDTDLLYSTNENGQTGLILFLNDGHGAFTRPFGLQVYPRMTHFLAEDLTGNGIMDLLGIGPSSGLYRLTDVSVQGYEIELLYEHPDMSLLAAQFSDLDGDGDTDVVASAFPGLLTYITQDDGSVVQMYQQSPSERMVLMRQFDFDDDGDLDLVGGVDDVLYTVRNDGPGVWTQVRVTNLAGDLDSIDTLDVNGDGITDFIISAGPSLARDSVLFVGTQSGGYFLAQNLGVGSGEHVGSGDYDGDGIDEYALASGTTMRTFQMEPDGTIVQTSESTTFRRVFFGVVADLQDDGDPDLIMTRQGLIYQVALNEGGADFRQSMNDVGVGARGVELVDMNGDGLLDAVTLSGDEQMLSVLPGLGDGYFGLPQRYFFDVVPSDMAVGDLDSDGSADVVVISFDAGTASLMFNDGTGVLAQIDELDVRERPLAVTIGDVTNNGISDLVFTNQVSPQRVGVALGFGGRVYFPPIPYDTLNTASDLGLDDVNGDGYLDIITVGSPLGGTDGRAITILQNNAIGFGTFAAPVGFDGGNRPAQLRLGDLNADGQQDLILLGEVLGDTDMQLRVLLADGMGGYIETRRWDSGVDVPSDVIVDFDLIDRDQDGDLDVFVWLANYSVFNTPYRFFINDSAGVLNANTDPVSAWLGVGLTAAGDVTGDGKDDLVFFDSVQGVLGTIHNGCVSYCRPDLDLSGGIDFFDVSLFLSGFTENLARGDWNDDGVWDFFDVSAFLNDYTSGCP